MNISHEIEVKDGYVQARVKFQAGGGQAVVMVGLDGWNYSKYDKREPDKWNRSSRGYNVRLTANAPLAMTIHEWRTLNRYVETLYTELLDGHYPVYRNHHNEG